MTHARRLSFALALALGAGLALARLADEFEDRGATLEQLLPRAESERLERLAAGFEPGEPVLVVLAGAQAEGWSAERVSSLESALRALPEVEDVRAFPLPERLTGSSGVRVLAVTAGRASAELDGARSLDHAMSEVLARARRAGERAYALGRPRLRSESWSLARGDVLRLLPALTLLAVAVPWAFLGAASAGLFALLVAAATTALSLWGYRLVCGPLDPLALLVVPLLWAIATMDALHLAHRVRTSAGVDGNARMRSSRAALLAPCGLTSATTAVGLAGMALFGHSGLLRELGLVAAAGTLLAWALTFGPLAGLAAPWGLEAPPPRWPERLGTWLARRARRAPRAWVLAWGSMALAALAGIPALRVTSAFPRVFAAEVPLERDLDHLAAALGTDLAPLEVIVTPTDESGRRPEALLGAVLVLANWLRTLPEVRLVLPLDALEARLLPDPARMPSPPQRAAALEELLERPELGPWIDRAAGRARLQVHLSPTAWSRRQAILEGLQRFGTAMLAHHALEPAGSGYVAQRAEQLGLGDLAGGTLLSATGIALVLALGLRSFRIWSAALVASALPLLLVGGAMGLAGIPWTVALLPLPGVLFGIALDDSIHLLWRGGAHGRASPLGPCLATTTLVAGSVATLAWSSFQANRAFGLLLALGLVLALAADLTLLPALVRGRTRRSGG